MVVAHLVENQEWGVKRSFASLLALALGRRVTSWFYAPSDEGCPCWQPASCCQLALGYASAKEEGNGRDHLGKQDRCLPFLRGP
jgi:hypothetical protein